MVAKDEEKRIEVLDFRRRALTTPKNRGTKGELAIVKHKGKKTVREKLRTQLMKHYGFALKDN